MRTGSYPVAVRLLTFLHLLFFKLKHHFLEYAQALAFDQLFNIMRNGQAFVGFREATINFPPTFKYDVLRSIKHKHKGSKHRHTAANALARLSHGRHTPEAGEELEPDRRHDGALSELSSEDEAGDLASVVSSGTTFSQRDPVSDEDNDSDAESDYLRRRMSFQQRGGGLVKRFSVTAAQRAKTKLAELINAQSSPRIIRSRRANVAAPQPEVNNKGARSVPTTPLLSQRVISSITDEAEADVLSNAPSVVSRGRSTRSFTGDGTVQDEDDKGVYDSSSKQRVPSWCDRILFKSTVKPDPDPEDDAPTAAPRTAVSLLAQAWRSFRRSSTTSLHSTATVATTISGASTTSAASSSTTMSPTESEHESPTTARPLPQQQPPPYVPRRRRARPRSIDVAALQPVPLASSRPGTSPAKSTLPGAPSRAATSPFGPLTAPPEPYSRTQPRSSTDGGDGGGHQRWRLLSFLSRDGEATRDVDDAAMPSSSSSVGPDTVTAVAESPRPRKGDVVCLSYRTLDDRGMRQLEGRSDHRPVIGVYAIYV